CCWVRNFFRAERIGSSSSTTSTDVELDCFCATRTPCPSRITQDGVEGQIWVERGTRRTGLRHAGNELRLRGVRHEARAMRPGQEFVHGATPARAGVQ